MKQATAERPGTARLRPESDLARRTLTALRLLVERWSRGGLPVHEWDGCFAFLPKRLIDGSLATGSLMRRWHGQRWQYRRETDVEARSRVTDDAW